MKTFFVAVSLLTALPMAAATIQAPGAIWEYSYTTPTEADWTTNLGGWQVGPAPFGNTFDPFFGYQNGTYWGANTDIYIRRAVDFTGFDLDTIHWDAGVDNGFTMYINGELVTSVNAEGFAFQWEYGGDFDAGMLNPGINILALVLEDHGGATGFEMQIIGEPGETNPIPEPSAIFGSLALGACALARLARRKR